MELDTSNIGSLVFFAFFYAGVLAFYLWWIFWHRYWRPKPDGYVGRFKGPDGSIVHVLRLVGEFMVISEEKPGVMPRDLGNVSGRTLMRWEKLSSSPDGDELVARPQ